MPAKMTDYFLLVLFLITNTRNTSLKKPVMVVNRKIYNHTLAVTVGHKIVLNMSANALPTCRDEIFVYFPIS
ncbi:MAG: hypothetical protein BWY90_00203 [Deltaproteobacteria bacterium ADurb.BinA014]|nr:MAG: hypothetical protein BWY90_00203 [Deltaproteobacteria bacterium ADurb.BinA014]